jgi:membrane-associated protease RseP (regulator of RpoE activity)
MANLLMWVLVGLGIYTVIAMALRAYGFLPESVKVSGPIMTIHTKRGRELLDRLSKPKRFWRAWGNFGVGITLVVMVISGIVVVISVLALLSEPEQATVESPQNVLVIPGVNEFLPLSAAGEIIFGLLVGLVVHEGGHGLLCRVEDIEIESMGIALFSFVPLGAFVEPDPESQQNADRGAQSRMFAAGITNNFAVTIITMVGLIAVGSIIGVVAGAPVGDTFPGSGAADAGIERGDVITEVNGTAVENATEFEQVLDETRSDRLAISRKDGEDALVNRRLLITGVVPEVVEGISFDGAEQPRILAVNDTKLNTEQQFAAAVENRTVAELTTNSGNATIPIGAYAFQVDADGPLADAGAPKGTSMILTRLDGTRISNTSGFRSVIDEYDPGETITVETYIDGSPEQFNVTLGADDAGDPIMGVFLEEGYSGLLFNDFGVDTYPATTFLSILGGGTFADASPISGFLGYMGGLLLLPFATLIDPDLAYNFAGFTSDVSGFFVVQGPLSMIGGGVFIFANLLFWTWWINFNLALFNCIPAFPLDGGHILRTSTESIVSRLPIPHGRTLVTLVTVSVTLAMGAALAVLVFGPLWLT